MFVAAETQVDQLSDDTESGDTEDSEDDDDELMLSPSKGNYKTQRSSGPVGL